MLGLFLIYFVGKAFYDLALRHDKHGWGLAIAGVASYYAGTFIGGIILFLGFDLLLEKPIEEVPEMALNLMAIPFGVLACWALYKILENNFINSTLPDDKETEVLDGNLIEKP